MALSACSSACFLLISSLVTAAAQMKPPLQGQGIDPVTAGYADSPVQVYVSVELSKLVNLDEKEYNFQAMLNFYQSWYDDRSAAAFNISNTGANQQKELYKAADRCAAEQLKDGSVNLTSPDCQQTTGGAPSCNKPCRTYGNAAFNPYECCDLVWLPDTTMRNLIDTSQDRVTQELIWNFDDTGVYRQVAVNARFYASLNFHSYPFDRQRLQIFLDPNNENDSGDTTFVIVPSAAFRHLNQQLEPGSNRTGEVTGLSRDELAGWNIDNVTFSCTFDVGNTGNRPLSLQTQPSSLSDPMYQYYLSKYNDSGTALFSLNQTCAVTIDISRLANTATVQSILPVAFIGALAFVVFFTPPDAIDIRLGTEITLFLALTAVQFIFSSKLPITSYLTDFDAYILLNYCLIVLIVLENLVVCNVSTRDEHHARGGGSKQAAGDHKQENGDEEMASMRGGQKMKTGPLALPFSHRAYHKFVEDPAFAYRLACLIDGVFAVVVLIAYIVLSVLCFTAGLQ